MTESVQLARFLIGDVHYAVDIMQVSEVIQAAPLTPIPGAPAFVEGLVELRTDFLPVVDVRRRLGVTPGEGSKIIIATARGRRIGLLVDAVLDVFRVAPDAIRAVDAVPTGPMLRGVIRVAHGPVMVLDPDGLFSELEIGQLDALST